jgi:hypothetical protein
MTHDHGGGHQACGNRPRVQLPRLRPLDIRWHGRHQTGEGVQYEMQPFMESCVDAYRKIVGKPGLHLPRVDTPFLGEEGGGNAPPPKEDEWKHYAAHKAWCRIHNSLRCALFTPVGVSGGPDPENLLPDRLTRMIPGSLPGGGGNAPDPVKGTSITDIFVHSAACNWTQAHHIQLHQ